MSKELKVKECDATNVQSGNQSWQHNYQHTVK